VGDYTARSRVVQAGEGWRCDGLLLGGAPEGCAEEEPARRYYCCGCWRKFVEDELTAVRDEVGCSFRCGTCLAEGRVGRGLSPSHNLESVPVETERKTLTPTVDMVPAPRRNHDEATFKVTFAVGGSIARVDCVAGTKWRTEQGAEGKLLCVPDEGRKSAIADVKCPFIPGKKAYRRVKELAARLAAEDGVPPATEHFERAAAIETGWQKPAEREKAKRGKVYGFSAGSRTRLRRRLNSVNRLRWPKERVLFLSLTYPDQPSDAYPQGWPRDPRVWKKHLAAFTDAFEAKWGTEFPFIWKLEFQDRKSGDHVGEVAPHFHLLSFVPLAVEPDYLWLIQFKAWLSEAWFRVVGSGDEKHERAGTNVTQCRSWNGIASYAAKYMQKDVKVPTDPETGEPLPVGRFWGCHRLECLGIEFQEEELTMRGAYAIRRAMRKLIGAALRAKGRYKVKLSRHLRRWGSSYTLLSATEVERLVRWAEGRGAAPWGPFEDAIQLRPLTAFCA
jgi:hypothetical protein